jgi:hypothetical protein
MHGVWGAQASVNPKAETVEELQGRRKALHMGMLKLLREDLVLSAESMLADSKATPDMHGIKGRIMEDFDDHVRDHFEVGVVTFNVDVEYKRLMNEAIDGKTYALKKMGLYLESGAANMSHSDKRDIFQSTLQDFANKATVLQLQTGITDFPWAAVVLERNTDLDLGDWDASSVSAKARELVAGALGGNPNVRSVLLKGCKLELKNGWATTELKWGSRNPVGPPWSPGNPAFKAAPATASLLLRNCSCLSDLDVR